MKKYIAQMLALFFAAVVLSPSIAQAQSEYDAKMAMLNAKTIPADPDIRIGTLNNGMKYYIKKNQKPEDRVELRLAVNAGAMQEDDDQQGLAHFVEHMAFNGSTNFKKNELVDYLESVGTKFGPDLNAYTSFDETVYMLQTRTDDQEILMKGLLVMEDWASGVAFAPEEIDKERGVVESEWRSRLSAQQRMQNQYFPVMYQGSRYANRLPIGKPEIIRNADYETVKRFYKDWYRTDLMAMIIVGDIDVDQMEQEIKARFGKIKRSPTYRKKESNDVPDHKETLVSIVSDKEAPFTNIRMMYKHDFDVVDNMKDYRAQIIHRLYNTMLGARLDEISQGPNPPFNFAYSGYGGDVGKLATYESFAMVPEGAAERALEVIVTENERVLRHGFQATELERAKVDILKSREKAYKERDKTDSRRFATRYVYNFLDRLPIPSIEAEYEWYKEFVPNISLVEVNQLAKRWITDDNRVVVISGPEKPESPMPTKAAVLEIMSAVKNADIAAYVDKTQDGPLVADELKPTNITARKILAQDINEIVLENGVKVVFKHTDFKNDEVQMRAISPGGNSQYPDADYAQAQFAAQIINNSGLGEFDAVSLQKKLTGKVVSVSPWIGERFEGLRGSSSPDDLETMLKLSYLFFKSPRKDPAAVESFVTRQKSVYKNLMSQPDYFFMDKAMEIKFNNHPRRGFPTAENMDKIDADEVYRIYQDRFADAGDFTFIFVGNYDKDSFEKLVTTYLGNLPNTGRKETWKDVNADYVDKKITERFNRGEAPKSQIDLTWHGDFDFEDEDNKFNFNAMIAVLKIKMRESMREDKGGVYGVRVSGNANKYPKSKYSITVSFNADPPRVDELIETALKDIADAKANGADDKTLTKVKETMRQSRVKALKENRFWMGKIEDAYQNDTDMKSLSVEDLDKMLAKLTSDDIKSSASSFFNMDNKIEVVMMPEVVKAD